MTEMEEVMPRSNEDSDKPKRPRKPRKREETPQEPQQINIPLSQLMAAIQSHMEERHQRPDLAAGLEKMGLGESQEAQRLKASISFLKAYEKEHKAHIELLSNMTLYKFVCLKTAGFTPEQAFAVIINKSVFEF